MFVETNRTIVRDFKLTDSKDVCQFYFDPDTTFKLGHKPFESEEAVKNMILLFKATLSHFAIELKDSGKVIGFIAINPDYKTKRNDVKDIGFVINKDYRRSGYMKEVLTAIVPYIFEAGYKEITASCYKDNYASSKTLESCGFKRNGESVITINDYRKNIECYDYILVNPNIK